MEEVKYDFIVFGVTGYTGKFVAEEIYSIQNSERQSLKWAVAGRSEDKINRTLQGTNFCARLCGFSSTVDV